MLASEIFLPIPSHGALPEAYRWVMESDGKAPEPEVENPAESVAPKASGTATEVSDAGQLRSERFRTLLRSRKNLTGLIGITLLVTIVGAFYGPASAVIGLVVTAALGLLVIYLVARHQARQAFFDSYSASRGLARVKPALGSPVPFLGKGDSRKVDEGMSGTLEPGIEGVLCLYTYTVTSSDGDGNQTSTDYPFTIVFADLPEVTPFMPELFVRKKSGLKALEKFEDAFRGNHERVTLESEAMRDRYEVFVRKDQDPVWVRELFSPSFIVWLTDTPPGGFAFEIANGKICCFVPGHRTTSAGLDEVKSVGCAVIRRLREEASEGSPPTPDAAA